MTNIKNPSKELLKQVLEECSNTLDSSQKPSEILDPTNTSIQEEKDGSRSENESISGTREFQTKVRDEKKQFQTGAQREIKQGKGRYDLISPLALKRVAGIYERGAREYGDRNWEKGLPFSSFIDSALRHLYQFIEGKEDEDHVAACLWNIIGLVHTEEMVHRGLLPRNLNDLPNYIKQQENK